VSRIGKPCSRLQAYAEVSPVNLPTSSELISDPQDVARCDGKAKIVIALTAPAGSNRDGQPASNQAEKLPAQVGDHSATITWVERCLNLDQPAKLPRPQLQCSVQARNMSATYRMAQPERVAYHKDLAPQHRLLTGDLNRTNRAGGNPEKSKAALGIGGNPMHEVLPAGSVARYN
jgi:hypothetical protein